MNLYCEACGDGIEDRRGHWIAGGRLFCSACAASPTAHRIAFAGCAVESHDVTDHDGSILATRDGAVWALARYSEGSGFATPETKKGVPSWP